MTSPSGKTEAMSTGPQYDLAVEYPGPDHYHLSTSKPGSLPAGQKNAKKVLESFFFLSTFYYFKPGEQFHKTCEKSKEVFNAEGPGPGARA